MGQWIVVNVYDSTWLDLTGFNLDNNTRIVDMCLYIWFYGDAYLARMFIVPNISADLDIHHEKHGDY